MEEAKVLGMRGFEIWDVGVYRASDMVTVGPAFLGEESLKSIKHAMSEAKRLGLELNMIAASSWNAGGAWVKKPDGSKRIASSAFDVTGPKELDAVLPLPCDNETYYYDISVLAVPQSKDKKLASLDLSINLTDKMNNQGQLKWDVPPETGPSCASSAVAPINPWWSQAPTPSVCSSIISVRKPPNAICCTWLISSEKLTRATKY
jgi:hypothetical protein